MTRPEVGRLSREVRAGEAGPALPSRLVLPTIPPWTTSSIRSFRAAYRARTASRSTPTPPSTSFSPRLRATIDQTQRLQILRRGREGDLGRCADHPAVLRLRLSRYEPACARPATRPDGQPGHEPGLGCPVSLREALRSRHHLDLRGACRALRHDRLTSDSSPTRVGGLSLAVGWMLSRTTGARTAGCVPIWRTPTLAMP